MSLLLQICKNLQKGVYENLNQASRSLNGLIQLTRTDLVFSDSVLSLWNLILIFVRQAEPGIFTGTEIGPSVHSSSSAELVMQVSSSGKVALCSQSFNKEREFGHPFRP